MSDKAQYGDSRIFDCAPKSLLNGVHTESFLPGPEPTDLERLESMFQRAYINYTKQGPTAYQLEILWKLGKVDPITDVLMVETDNNHHFSCTDATEGIIYYFAEDGRLYHMFAGV